MYDHTLNFKAEKKHGRCAYCCLTRLLFDSKSEDHLVPSRLPVAKLINLLLELVRSGACPEISKGRPQFPVSVSTENIGDDQKKKSRPTRLSLFNLPPNIKCKPKKTTRPQMSCLHCFADCRYISTYISAEEPQRPPPPPLDMPSDGHDKPFCIKAIVIIDNFKKAIPIIDKTQFLKAISVIDKLSSIIFSDKCYGKFSIRLTKFFFVSHYCKNIFLDFSRKESSSQTLPWHQSKQREILLNCNKTLLTPCIFP